MINKCLKLYKKNEEVYNYLIIGFLTTVVNLACKYLLLFTVFNASVPIELQTTVIISWIVAVLFAYVTNRLIVFKSKNKNIKFELIKFIVARITTLVVEMVYMWFFITLLNQDSNKKVVIWTISCQILVIILNYVFSKLFVFKKNDNRKTKQNM